MQEQNSPTIIELIDCPGALKVLLALTEIDQTYSFQLTRITGHHSRTLEVAFKLLLRGKMLRVVPPKVRIKNTGDYYALTTHGRIVAKCLLDLQESLRSMPISKT
jgi:hypothetical protein